jgi:hypothetical protein
VQGVKQDADYVNQPLPGFITNINSNDVARTANRILNNQELKSTLKETFEGFQKCNDFSDVLNQINATLTNKQLLDIGAETLKEYMGKTVNVDGFTNAVNKVKELAEEKVPENIMHMKLEEAGAKFGEIKESLKADATKLDIKVDSLIASNNELATNNDKSKTNNKPKSNNIKGRSSVPQIQSAAAAAAVETCNDDVCEAESSDDDDDDRF